MIYLVAAIVSLVVLATPTSGNTAPNNWFTVSTSSYAPQPRFGSAAANVGGQMVIFGGVNSTGAFDNAGVFNDTWYWDDLNYVWCELFSTVPTLPASRYFHSAASTVRTDLPYDGEDYFLIYGGIGASGSVLGDLWALVGYDIAGLEWKLLARNTTYQPLGRYSHASVASGFKMYVLGGTLSSNAVTNTGLIYDVVNDEWKDMKMASPPTAVTCGTLLVHSNSLYFCGGYAASGPNVVMYRASIPKSDDDAWSFEILSGYPPSTPFVITAAVMAKGQIIGFGTTFQTILLTAYSFDLKTNLWSQYPLNEGPMDRNSFVAVNTDNSTAMMFGGVFDVGLTTVVNELWTYILEDNTWEPMDPPKVPPARRFATSVYMTDPYKGPMMIIYGGSSPTFFDALSDTWALMAETSEWRNMAYEPGFVPPGRRFHTAAVLYLEPQSTYYMTVFGGETMNGTSNDMYRYCPIRRRWWQIISLNTPSPRSSMTAVSTLDQSEMLVFGGVDYFVEDFNTTYVYNILQNAWTLLQFNGTVPPSRFCHVAAMLSNGVRQGMMVFGGESYAKATDTIFLLSDLWFLTYNHGEDPVWILLSTNHKYPSPEARALASAVGIGSKFVLVGGTIADGTVLSDMWVYDLNVRRWFLVNDLGDVGPVSGASAITNQPTWINRTLYANPDMIIYGGTLMYTEAIRPGCNPGYSSPNYALNLCQPCEVGYYQDLAGQTSCKQCPGSSSTETTGAVLPTECNICKPNLCNGHGVCSITAGTAGVFECACDTGYLASDSCAIPWTAVEVGSVLGGVCLLLVIVLVGIRARRYRLKQAFYERLLDDANNDLATSQKTVQQLEAVFEIDYRSIQMFERLDSGSFGDVYRGSWAGRIISIKVLKEAIYESDPLSTADFEREIKFLRTIRHPNIVFFYGTGQMEGHVPFLVTEFMERGSLRSILHNPEIVLDQAQRLRFALDAAKGLRFLHSLSPPLCHRDIKSGNLLVNDRWCLKVADFGTAKLLDSFYRPRGHTVVEMNPENKNRELNINSPGGLASARLMTKGIGTLLWQAPEMFRGEGYSCPSDVYSFGIVLWEIETRRLPFEDQTDVWGIETAVLRGERPHIPSTVFPELADLIGKCWAQEPADRVQFKDAVTRLDAMLENPSNFS